MADGLPAIKRLDTRHLARHARRAIRERLGPPSYPVDGVLAVEHDGADVVIRLNSGGNSLAVEAYLRQRGYQADPDASNPDGYGCAVRVRLASIPDTDLIRPRPLEAARLAAQGLTDCQIAADMGVSLATAILHLRRARKAAGTPNRAALIAWIKEHHAAPAAFDVQPGTMEVAAVWLPAGVALTLHGEPVREPDLEFGRYAEAGWDRVSGGCRLVAYGSWQGMRNGKQARSRAAWAEAAGILRKAARAGTGPAVVYVVIENTGQHARPVLTAVRVRCAAEAAG